MLKTVLAVVLGFLGGLFTDVAKDYVREQKSALETRIAICHDAGHSMFNVQWGLANLKRFGSLDSWTPAEKKRYAPIIRSAMDIDLLLYESFSKDKAEVLATTPAGHMLINFYQALEESKEKLLKGDVDGVKDLQRASDRFIAEVKAVDHGLDDKVLESGWKEEKANEVATKAQQMGDLASAIQQARSNDAYSWGDPPRRSPVVFPNLLPEQMQTQDGDMMQHHSNKTPPNLTKRNNQLATALISEAPAPRHQHQT
jgi:hypothetical protein